MSHDRSTAATVAGRDLDDFLVDPNFQGAFVGGPPLMTHEQARQIIENPAKIQERALAALRQLAEEAEDETVDACEGASLHPED